MRGAIIPPSAAPTPGCYVPPVTSPADEYDRRLRARRQTREAADGSERRISNARLSVFVFGVLLAIVAWRTDWSAAWLLVPAGAFVVLVVAHERTSRRAKTARRAEAHYEAGQRRLVGTWAGHGVVRDDLAPPDHPYASDLDLFGSGSMFDRLCTARTGAGVGCLARWLLEPADPDEVTARQRAVTELKDRVDLRESIALAGEDLDAQVDPQRLAEWGEQPTTLDPARAARLRVVAWTMAAANLAATVAWAAGPFGPEALIGTALVTWILDRKARDFTDAVEVGVERPSRELAIVAQLLRRFEDERFEDPRLSSLRAELIAGPAAASTQIGHLVKLAQWLEARRGQLFSPIAFGLMWRAHFGLAIERWRRAHGPQIATWFSALGELEALAAISAYAYERPDDPFPTFVDGPPSVQGDAVGHPLLPADRGVRNGVQLGPGRRACVVSGSNMSGKSTYLRTVGLNVVLAQAGAPVCAERLALSPLRVGATLRVQDSLSEGASRFYAEITRLRRVMDLTEAGPGVLFLLDEILHGTNSHDRRIGAIAVVRRLLERGAIGLVTTHDLALADAAAELPGDVANVHFADRLGDEGLHFDYTLRPGVVQTSNALDLMRSVGLDV
jgi:chromate transport protein ChrA